MSNNLSIEDVLQKLADGNKRYVSSAMLHPNQTAERRAEVSKGQNPFAVIVGCSDSRIPPEILFDQGIGDLFVIRVAGNIADEIALGSIEYAVEHLGTQLVMVLGHGKCGAVNATVQGGEIHGNIAGIIKTIAPAVEKVRGKPGDLADNAIRANVGLVVDTIMTSKPILAKLAGEGKIKVVGAYYNIESGLVEIL